MRKENYLQITARELGSTKELYPIPTVSDAVRLTQLVRRPVTRRHAAEFALPEGTPPTLLCGIVKQLVEVNARFEPPEGETYLCGAAEWHFTNALANPHVEDGRKHPYEQTIIYTHNKRPIIVAKGDPHGKPAAIVCGSIDDGDKRFTLGMMGLLRNRYDLRPSFHSDTAGVVIRSIPDDLRMRIIRPSTWVSFPPDIRRNMINHAGELSGADAEVHRHGSIEKLAQAAARLVDQYS